jgi:DNA-binding NarL/FixJ family response regulator
MRLGLRALLADSDIEIAGEADRPDSPDFIDAEADVLIYAPVSASLPAFKQDGANSSFPGASTAVLFLADDPPSSRSLDSFGEAWGALPLESSREELIAAVHALAQGLVVGAPRFFQARPAARPDPDASPLSDRELEVLGLLAQGLANKQIAGRLGISEHTVKFHVSSIYTKLDVTNRAEAVRQGVRQGLIAV